MSALGSCYLSPGPFGRLPVVDNLEEIAALLRNARFAVALTGAGVSTASGIPDYRTPGTGLWENVDPMEVAHIDSFLRDASRFWSFYKYRMGDLDSARPNASHYALAQLEEAGFIKGLITQNIDRLHRRAGSKNLAEVHGSIEQGECLRCGRTYPHEAMVEATSEGRVPYCECGYALKPAVVFFGETLPEEAYARAGEWARRADVLLVAGSSLQVYPVAGLPQVTLSAGGKLVILTASSTPYDLQATVVERGPLEEVLPRLARLLLDDAAS
jgi:NAD-dependent deacetylase